MVGAERDRTHLVDEPNNIKYRFDIKSFEGFRTAEDEDGMMESVTNITQLIKAEIDSGLPANRIVLGGFSQGAAMSLLTGLTSELQLAGVVVLSGWLPLKQKFKEVCPEPTRILIGPRTLNYTFSLDCFVPCEVHASLLGTRHCRSSRQAGVRKRFHRNFQVSRLHHHQRR